jgi:hypothetical protein
VGYPLRALLHIFASRKTTRFLQQALVGCRSEGWPIVLKTIEGVYRDGKVALTEVPKDVCDETRVLVTFLISAAPKAAAPLKPRTSIY